MHATLRKLLCFTLALLLASTPLTRAQQTSTIAPAPVPSQITSARTIFIANGGGPNYFNAFTGGADRGYSQIFAALQLWNRYQIVDSPSQADLIFEIHAIAPAVDTGGAGGADGTFVYNPQLILRILDPKTNALLWTTTANVKAAGGQNSRDKGFDESVAVLIDHVRQLTGEQLNPAQVKAIRSNNQMPTSAKVFLGVGIGAFVGLAIFGIYRVTHRNTPTLPTIPACPNPPFCPA
ncbi:MAG TPA: DUF4136 domain-containing protein [Edaphobacter sp.]|jgi:hypothetical protein|nr:DUF4136 domain-containing protein [Edaphobacter sp.]